MKLIAIILFLLFVECSGSYDLISSGLNDYEFQIDKTNLEKIFLSFLDTMPKLHPLPNKYRDSIYLNDNRISDYKSYHYVFFDGTNNVNDYLVKIDSVDSYVCSVSIREGALSPSIIRLNGYDKSSKWKLNLSKKERDCKVIELFTKEVIDPFRKYARENNK